MTKGQGIADSQAEWWKKNKPHLIMSNNMMRPLIAMVAPKDKRPSWARAPVKGGSSISIHGGVVYYVVDRQGTLLLLIPGAASAEWYSTDWKDAITVDSGSTLYYEGKDYRDWYQIRHESD